MRPPAASTEDMTLMTSLLARTEETEPSEVELLVQQIEQLKRMVTQLKQQKVQQEQHAHSSELRAKDQKIEVLERACQRIREDSAEEVAHLHQQIDSLKDSVQAAKQQLETESESLRNSQHALSEMQQRLTDSEARTQSLAKDKIDLSDQAERLRQQALAAKEELKAKEEQLTEWQATTRRQQQSLAAVEVQLGESQKQHCLLQNALTDSCRDRERLVVLKGQLEADVSKMHQERLELEAKQHQFVEERSRQAAELQQQVEMTLQEQRLRLERDIQLDTMLTKIQSLQTELEQSGEAIALAEARSKEWQYQLQQQETQREQLEKELQQAINDKRKSDDELGQLRRQHDTLHADLQASQQHLAKKVKESARLNERIEEGVTHLRDLEKALDEAKKRAKEFEGELEKGRKRERETDEKHQTRLAEAQASASHWQDEYRRAHAKSAQLEETQRKLQELEAKYNKASSLLSNLGQLFETPVTKPIVEIQPKKVVEERPTEPPSNQDLFTDQPTPKRPKNNLFDL